MNKLKIHFLNTIWSDAIVLEKNQHYAMIDTGSSFYYPMVKKHLLDNNIQNIDFIFLTHFHTDHYGNISSILIDFNVSKLYLKHYHGLDGTTSSGYASNDEYIENEFRNYFNILETAKNNNTEVVFIDEIKDREFIINFQETKLDVFNYNNLLYELYSNPNSQFYNQKRFNENFNCSGIFIKEKNYNIYLGGDVTCSKTDIEEVRALSYKLISEVYKKYNISHIDLYKSCHHGGGGTNSRELTDLLKAKYVIITNTARWLDTWDTCSNLKASNPNVVILPTDYHKYIFTIDTDITYESIEELSLFLALNKN